MAKKKVTQKNKPTHQTITEVDASEKFEHLKSLNSMLLKDAIEHRQQMDSLLQSKGSLESELTRSETEKEALQAELTGLHDRTARMELERTLAFVFVNQQSEVIEKERREKAETETRLHDMERETREVLSEKEFEIGLLKRKMDQLIVEVEKERFLSSQLCQERDSLRTLVEDIIGAVKGLKSELYYLKCKNELSEKKFKNILFVVDGERDSMRTELGFQTKETIELKEKLTESEEREMKIQEEFHKLRTEYANLMEEKEESETQVKKIRAVKDKFERCLRETKWVNDELKGEIKEMMREKEVIEEEKKVEVEKKNAIEKKVSALKETIRSLQKEDERLRMRFAYMEKRCIEGVEKHKKKSCCWTWVSCATTVFAVASIAYVARRR